MQHTRRAKADEANAVIGYFGYDKTHPALMIFSGFHSDKHHRHGVCA